MKKKEHKMTAKMWEEIEIEIDFIICDLGVRHWEDGEIDGETDDNDKPKMPCVYTNNTSGEKRWYLQIDPKTGHIENWQKGHYAYVHYKICDDCDIVFHTTYGGEYRYLDYVPSFLAPEEEGYGDYAIMHIDENGYIRNWGARGALELDFTDEDLEEL